MSNIIDTSWYSRPPGVHESVTAGGVVVRREGQRVLVALVREAHLDHYILPKGAQETDETLEETARREIYEEAGLSDLTLLGKLGTRERLNYRKTAWKVIHYFLFLTQQKEGKPADAKHAYVCEWFGLDDLPPMLWQEQKEVLETQADSILSQVLGEDALQPVDEHNRVIVENLVDAILVLDKAGKALFANPAAQKLFPGADFESIPTFLKEQIEAGSCTEIVVEHPDRPPIILETCCSEIVWQGNPARLASLRDVTTRKHTENDAYTHLLAEVQEDLRREQHLTEVTRTISSALELSAILQNIVTLTIDLVSADVGALGLIIPSTRRITSPNLFNANESISDLRALPKGESLAWHMLDHHQPVLLTTERCCSQEPCPGKIELPRERLDELMNELSSAGVCGVIGAPIAVGEKQLGALLLYSFNSEKRFTERLLPLVDSVGRQAGVAIQNARLYEEIQEIAITDSLTGLYNRRHFYDLAHREMERSLRYNRSLSIVMCDIDFFKRVNDTYGHATGDQVLQFVTAMFIENFRQSDIVCRFGGEEFIIMMPETSLDEAVQVAERIRSQIADSSIHTANTTINVTLSFGVTHLEQSTPNGADQDGLLDSLIQRADQALYAAKQSGRNRVYVA